MLMLPVPTKARRRIKTITEQILLQGDLHMVSRIQKELIIIKESQGKKTLKVLQGTLHLPGTKVYFLYIAILVQTLGTWKNIVEKITKTNIMVLVNLLEAIFKNNS